MLDKKTFNMPKIMGISYASRKFSKRKNVVTKNANDSGFFDEFKCFTEDDIPEEFKENHKEVWNMQTRGGGYWIWKPYILQQALNELNEDDILVYIDSGCDLNVTTESRKRFSEYIDMINNSRNGTLRFELLHLEKKYTNKKTVEYFKKKYNIADGFMNMYLESPQLLSGIMFFKKTNFVKEFFKKFYQIVEDDAFLFTDEYTEFNESHRHDQSMLSMLEKIMYGGLILQDETYFDDGYFSSDHAKKFPIWATRKT